MNKTYKILKELIIVITIEWFVLTMVLRGKSALVPEPEFPKEPQLWEDIFRGLLQRRASERP